MIPQLFKNLTATNTEDNDGIVREDADLHLRLVIDDSANFHEAERGEVLIEEGGTTSAIFGEPKGSIELPDLSSMMVTDIPGISNIVIDSTATIPETSRTTSLKFTSFLPKDIDKSDPKSPPPMIAREAPLELNIASGTIAHRPVIWRSIWIPSNLPKAML